MSEPTKLPIRHLIRQIARISNPQLGYQTVEEVNAELSGLVLQGYKIVATHSLGAQMDPTMNAQYFGILYILQLEPTELEKLKKRAEKVE